MDDKEQREFYIKEAQDDFLWFASMCDPKYTPSKMHAFLADHLQAVLDGKIKRLGISVPPQTGKSRQVSIEFPCWALGKKPDLKIGLISYNQTHANDKSRDARARMQSEEYAAVFKTRITRGDGKIENWGVDGGGKYRAVGIGGTITGRPFDIIIIDDPVKDWQEVQSEGRMDYIWNWYWSSVYTRVHPKTAIIVLMTRWATDDLIGRLVSPQWQAKAIAAGQLEQGERWNIINLPALAHHKDPLNRAVGESVFPEKFPKEFYEQTKATTLPFIWSALYDGSPVVLGGNYIQVDKFKIVDEAPEDLRWVRGWDLATEAKETADETAGVAGAFGPDGQFYLKGMVHDRWQWPKARDTIAVIGEAERYLMGVEAVGGFKTAYQNLLEVIPPFLSCVEISVCTDKLTRALPWINLVAKGMVLVRGPWIPDFILQAERFSGKTGDDDDMIDCVSLTYQLLSTAYAPPSPVSVSDRFSRAMAARRSRSLDG